MSVCAGTSQEEAAKNRILRDTIVSSQDVKSLLCVYRLEDGSKVVLDQAKAADHVRYVLNDMRRVGSSEKVSI